MNNRRIFVKCLSFLLMITMTFVMSANIYAVNDTDEAVSVLNTTDTTKGLLSVDFLGTGDLPADISAGKAKFTTDNVGQKFWIGVSIDRFTALSIINSGVNTIEIGFDYDPDFVVPYEDSSSGVTWKSAVVEGNIKSGVDNQNTAWWTAENYEIVTAVPSAEVNTNSLRDELSLAEQHKDEGWKMCFANLVFTGTDSGLLRFLSTESDEKNYILKLPFLLVSAPEDGAEDLAPIVLSMSRGPQTFVIGSGAAGDEPYAAWESEVKGDEEDSYNLKTMFEFEGDISLFDGSDELTALSVYKANLAEDEAETEYILSHTSGLDEDDFFSNVYSYYLRVPNETESVKLLITHDEKPLISNNGEAVEVNSEQDVAQTQFSAIVYLSELDKDVNSGFNNDVVITSGSVDYHIYIQRLLKPTVELEYGNSPYGEIMRDDAITDKDAAIESFNVKNQYDVNYLPENVKDKALVKFTLDAWGEPDLPETVDPEINMDRNPYAIFAYEKTPFVDTGFTAIDSLGNVVDASKVERTIEITRLTRNDISEAITDDHKITLTITPGDNDLTTIVDPAKNLVRPGVYSLNYSFIDEPTGKRSPPVIRNIIVLPLLGDVDMQDGVNNNDTVPIISQVQKISNIVKDNVDEETKNLFLYRVCDVDRQDNINNNDTVPITAQVQKVGVITNFYKTTD